MVKTEVMDPIPYECMSNVYLSKNKEEKVWRLFLFFSFLFLGETCALLVHTRVKGEVMNSIFYEGKKNV